MNTKFTTAGRISILLGKMQAETGQRISPRKLAEMAGIPKDFIYRLDSGTARHIDLDALAKLCITLHCQPQDLLIWDGNDVESV